ncbi:hypothetical protein [Beijerinckia indica]|uniref:Uncharacterized protein n=1 Tax=Beijerinckia indica subsp. indica (strain ATCC 9039 / DSM 1715 / NCIMB 8712) TaxID=395963 RepID=B2IHX7_BEII9|nr:hypothetical protein [Beijerinckia indica]ACB96020.1 conserved hypothetical protein [Beijerinckia indica subsp. indica ATCC 9039]
MIDLLAFAYGLSIRLALASLATEPGPATLSVEPELTASLAYFIPKERSVANWRLEAAWHLAPTDSAAKMFTAEKLSPPRCVKLNNYWCIKHAGWNGTLGMDRENHVAFASVLEGATVAALLLKRYYVDYHRRTGRAIVSRWAPSPCASTAYPVPRSYQVPPTTTANLPQTVSTFPPRGSLTAHPTTRIGTQVRSRNLHVAGRFAHSKGRPKHHYNLEMMHAPEIAVGMGEDSLSNSYRTTIKTSIKTSVMTTSVTTASTTTMTSPTTTPFPSSASLDSLLSPSLPMTSCFDDPQRLERYAQRASQGVAANPDTDLHLFEANGTPTPNLARVLANMAQVEIGPLDVRSELIEAAIERARRQWGSATPVPDMSAAAAPSPRETIR